MATDICPFFGLDSKANSVNLADIQMHATSGCTKCLLLRSIAAKLTDRHFTFNPERIRNANWRRISYDDGPTSRSGDIEIFMAEGSLKLFPELQHRLLARNLSSKRSLSRAKKWISWCSNKHPSCQQQTARPLPRRVIDVSQRTVRVVETTTDQRGQYIALSHCWGSCRPHCLTKRSTRMQNMREIPWASLPNTFRDAIQVTAELGFRYLWIDSLCILQDDDADWKEESSKMASIYQNSYLTICATAARNDEAGLWPRKAQGRVAEKIDIQHAGKQYQVYIRDYEDVNAVHMMWNHSKYVWEIVQKICPLMSRGWTLQERLLAPRLLHYGHGELLWQCPELATCECCFSTEVGSEYMFGTGDLTNLARQMQRGKNREEVAKRWRLLVKFYSQLDLTLSKDVLPAVSDLAKACMSVRPGDVYLAGLWKSTLIDDLCWYVPFGLARLPRPETWRAPTWSWASVCKNATYAFGSSENSRIYARLIRSSTVLAGPDPTGEVLSGSLVLAAPVKTAMVTRVFGDLFQIAADSYAVFCYADSVTDFDTGLIRVGMTVLCLRLRSIDGEKWDWILVLTALEDGRPEVYQRIGIVKELTKLADERWYGSGSGDTEIEIV